MKLAIMGGTFNPIHIGHLVCAEEAVSEYGFDEILFMPAGWPPHKEVQGGVTSEYRYQMTALAVEDNPRFRVSRYELDRPAPSYTVDTVRHFVSMSPDAQIYFITGSDAILEILDWKDPKELLEMATLIAASRPGYPLDRFAEQMELIRQGRVLVLEIPAIGVSSTMIRERVAKNRSVRYLVPEAVRGFIEEKGLYRSP
ncbi:MAG: nicotinate-nucleotide adenylyltransferase [Thermoleophilia bacterium]|nr:nicotinate-nucleotide adenylyltransferase [Thermoleophilia bacterium]